MAPSMFRKDSIKIAWATQSLRGTPAISWGNVHGSQDGDRYTWEEYKRYLLDLIEDPENRALDAVLQYLEAKQRPGQTAQQFNQYLLSLEAQLDHPYNEEQRRIHLWAKLRPEVRAHIVNYQDIPKTRDAIVALATRQENTRKRFTSPPPDRGRSQPRPRQSSKPLAERITGDSGPRRSPSDSIPREGSRFRSRAICYNCQKEGHYAKDCRQRSAANTAAPMKPSNPQGKA
jgi:hypothetical protein